MALRPNSLSRSNLQPFPDDAKNKNTPNNGNDLLSGSSTNVHPHHYPATPNSSRHRPDTNSKSLEHHLDSALEILIQSSGILADASDGVTPQVRNTLRAINALVSKSMETPIYDPPPRFISVKKVAKWLQIPRSPR